MGVLKDYKCDKCGKVIEARHTPQCCGKAMRVVWIKPITLIGFDKYGRSVK